jgi:hypothetical protein
LCIIVGIWNIIILYSTEKTLTWKSHLLLSYSSFIDILQVLQDTYRRNSAATKSSLLYYVQWFPKKSADQARCFSFSFKTGRRETQTRNQNRHVRSGPRSNSLDGQDGERRETTNQAQNIRMIELQTRTSLIKGRVKDGKEKRNKTRQNTRKHAGKSTTTPMPSLCSSLFWLVGAISISFSSHPHSHLT